MEAVGLEPGEPLEVDDSGLVTGVDGQWLYAAGDVTGRAPLTHQGKYAARIVGAAIAARVDRRGARHARRGASTRPPPTTSPCRRWCSPTRRWRRSGGPRRRPAGPGIDVRVVDVPIAVGGSSLQADGYDGAARLVVDAGRGRCSSG